MWRGNRWRRLILLEGEEKHTAYEEKDSYDDRLMSIDSYL